MKYELAMSVIKQWDTPEMFDDKSLFVEISTAIGVVTGSEEGHKHLSVDQSILMAQICNGALQAVTNAVENASDSDKPLLIDTLGELIEFSALFSSKKEQH
ncbi:hypothetical protein [Alteromonas facilis]|uniref:hypothetical protein n=1 Tax=Alteromonas facilis TaxID=2048004 RepID=UPI000C293109|nr:hypothetical protein [Alteromonas facilis]